MTEPRFLVVRLGSLGDIVHTFPAVAALRDSFPHAEIVWLTHPRWKELVESSEVATDIWETETRSHSSLRPKSSEESASTALRLPSTIKACGSPRYFHS